MKSSFEIYLWDLYVEIKSNPYPSHEIEIMIEDIEREHPWVKEKFDTHKAIRDSFTPEQVDFICYQIGSWYCQWKDKILGREYPLHHLGFAKEMLKNLIVGGGK